MTEPMPAANGYAITALLTRHYRAPEAMVVVELIGEVDLATEEVMRAALASAAAIPGTRRLICDMARVTFFSCAGLNILLDLRTILERQGTQLRVVARWSTVVLLFGITDLAETLGLCATIEEAKG